MTRRDYTYIDDIDPGRARRRWNTTDAPFDIFNLGESDDDAACRDLITLIEQRARHARPRVRYRLPERNPATCRCTCADISKARRAAGLPAHGRRLHGGHPALRGVVSAHAGQRRRPPPLEAMSFPMSAPRKLLADDVVETFAIGSCAWGASIPRATRGRRRPARARMRGAAWRSVLAHRRRARRNCSESFARAAPTRWGVFPATGPASRSCFCVRTWTR